MNEVSAVRWGGISMFLAVALGAFAAHGLKGRLSPESLAVFETAVRYQITHALALFVVAGLYARGPSAMLSLSGWLFVAGIILFSGSLYALALTGIRPLGMVTPLGGLMFLAGWACLVLGVR